MMSVIFTQPVLTLSIAISTYHLFDVIFILIASPQYTKVKKLCELFRVQDSKSLSIYLASLIDSSDGDIIICGDAEHRDLTQVYI